MTSLEIAVIVIGVISIPLLAVLGMWGISQMVSPQEMSDYRIKVRDFRRAGMSDEQICKELKISKKFLQEIERKEE